LLRLSAFHPPPPHGASEQPANRACYHNENQEIKSEEKHA
jgi:hypothetical protein